MSEKIPFYTNNNETQLIERYERYLKGKDSGYFDIEEIARIIDYYLVREQTHNSLQALQLGKKLHPISSILDIRSAKISLSLGKTKEAYQIISNIIEEDEEVELLKIELLLKMSMTNEAHQVATNLLANETTNKDEMADDIALPFINQKLYSDAIKWLKIGLKVNPKNVSLLLDLAFCYEQNHNNKKAFAIYEKAINTEPYNNTVWFNMGALHFKLKEFTQALECFDFAVTIDENDEFALLHKAHSFYHLKKWEEAKENYTLLLDSWLDKWQINFFIADCYENLGQLDEALEYYFKVEKEMPTHYETLTGIAYCFLQLEELENALFYLNKAIKTDRNLPDAWAYAGETFMELEMYEEALIAFAEAIIIDSTQSEVFFSMGNIYMEINDFKMAFKCYKLAYHTDNTIENIELAVATAAFHNKQYEEMLHYLQLAENRNLDATEMFLEMCPKAEKFLQK